jgi:mannosylfructose-phosphate synthase
VITTEGGLWEQVTWGLEAIYANPFDPEAFGHAIATVLMRPRVRDQLAKFGSQKARMKFTWNGVAQQLLRVLQGVELPAAHNLGPEGSAAGTPSASRLDEEEEPWRAEVYSY